jgi:hypothetical protein
MVQSVHTQDEADVLYRERRDRYLAPLIKYGATGQHRACI